MPENPSDLPPLAAPELTEDVAIVPVGTTPPRVEWNAVRREWVVTMTLPSAVAARIRDVRLEDRSPVDRLGETDAVALRMVAARLRQLVLGRNPDVPVRVTPHEIECTMAEVYDSIVVDSDESVSRVLDALADYVGVAATGAKAQDDALALLSLGDGKLTPVLLEHLAQRAERNPRAKERP